MLSLDLINELFDRWERVWNHGELDLVASCVAPRYLRHEDTGDRVVSPEEYVAEIEKLRQERPDLQIVAYDHAIQGDRAWYRVDFRWTDEVTGKAQTRASIQIWRIEDGKFAEAWIASLPIGSTWGDAVAQESWTNRNVRQSATKKLFTRFQLGKLDLRNRIVMAPMTRSRAIGNLPNDLMSEYYAARADAGLIITEGTSPSPNGLGQPRIPGLFNVEQIAAWCSVTDAVHKNGGKIFVQLMHTGRVAHPVNLPAGSKMLAPSAAAIQGDIWTDANGHQPYPVPSEMTDAEIENAIGEFVQAARYALEAGFDGVELNAANGYLIEQFLNPNVNRRSDAWGGNRRAAFALETARRTVEAIGGDRVGVRISPYGVINDTGPFEGIDEFYGELASQLSDLGLIYVHVVDHSSMGAPAVSADLKQKIRSSFRGAYILSGGYDASRAEQELKQVKGDLVAFGRPFVANPDLVERLRTGAPLHEPDPNTFYTPGPEGYTTL
ncbi:oxidoreductase [Bosea beijingensis]